MKLGLNPLSKDTDNDGEPDNKEKINQKIKVEIEEEEKPEIRQIQVQMKADGNIENTTTIESVYQKDIMSSEVEGLIGVPVEITSESDFKEATITFYYDETLLGETEEDNLAVMWYDEENETYRIFDEESVINKEKHCISYTTTHFSTYMVVDKKKWYEVWSKTINYRRRGTEPVPVVYYDFVYTVDCSGSMSGERMTVAKKALKSFADAMLDKDRAAIVAFESEAKLVSRFTTDRDLMKKKIDILHANGGTDVNKGLKKSIQEIKDNGKNEKKCIVLICDGDVSYNKSIINSTKESDISIYTILVGNDRNDEEVLDKIAKDTGGKSYYADTASEIEDAMYCLKEETISEIDKTDTDGDGLYDTYEIAGMRIPNGQVIYTDPLKADTDGDGLSDQEEMGRLKPNTTRRTKGKVTMCFQYKSNPRKKDTDGDGYNDKVDPRPKESDVTRVALSKEKDFLKIVDEDGKVYYGGDQDWYDKKVARDGACGTVAAANMTAYMASTNDKYKKLYEYGSFKKEYFLTHMKKVYKYLSPRKIPFTECPLGIWPLSMFERGMKKYAKSYGVELKPVHKKASYNKKNTTDYIVSRLEKDLPVALLLGQNSKFDGHKVTMPDGYSWPQKSFARHWMTITAIKIDNIKKKTTLKVSTWGGYAYLDLDDCINGEELYQALIYFE